MTTETVAIFVNSSLPQLDCQSSTRVADDDDADTRRYASICQFEPKKQTIHFQYQKTKGKRNHHAYLYSLSVYKNLKRKIILCA